MYVALLELPAGVRRTRDVEIATAGAESARRNLEHRPGDAKQRGCAHAAVFNEV